MPTTIHSSDSQEVREYFYAYAENNGVPTGPPIITNASHLWVWENFRNGYENPMYKALIKSGQGATTHSDGLLIEYQSVPFMSFSRTQRGVVGTAYEGDLRVNQYAGYPSASDPGPYNPVVDTSAVNRVTALATARFVAKIKATMSSFESGQDIGELKQTIEGIIHPMKSLKAHVLQYFDSVKKLKGKYKKAVSLKKALSDTYLEWTFGWNPLAADISAGIANLGATRPSIAPVEASASEDVPFQNIAGVSQSCAPNCYYLVSRFSNARYQCRLKGMVNVDTPSTPPGLARDLQLLPQDFVPTLWDLLPYSFVADYFANVGDILSSVSLPSAVFAWGNSTIRIIGSVIQTYSYDPALTEPPDPHYTYSTEFSANNLEVTATSFNRNIMTPNDLIPPFVFNIPMSSKPWENMAALMIGKVKALGSLL